MRARRLALGAVTALALLGAAPAWADAGELLVLRADGSVRVGDDVAPAARWPAPSAGGTGAPGASAVAAARVAAGAPGRAAAAPRRTVVRELARLLAAGALTQEEHDLRRASYLDARGAARRLTGARRVALAAAVAGLEGIAARGALTGPRVRPLWLTLEANRRWWTTGPLLGPGQRVGLEGSELVWQHYPGQGLQLQVLASFGKLNGLWAGGARYTARIAALVDELLALAVPRAGGLAWESYFPFGIGQPPWVSAMAQATGLQALARAGVRLGRQEELFAVARAGLNLFEAPPPEGVRVASGAGAHYLLYSFDPDLRVLNGFVQSLIGLWDVTGLVSEPRALALFQQGDAALREELAGHDTGAWSLYSRGRVERESDLGYHLLVRDFLGGLCARTTDPLYCATRARFDAYVREPPRIGLLTARVRGGRAGALRLSLSKASRVTVTVRRGEKVVLARGPVALGWGERELAWEVPRAPGSYAVALRAVDLAGNAGEGAGEVEVLRPRRARRARSLG